MFLLQLAAIDAKDADWLADLLIALPAPDTSAAAALEIDGGWRVDAYYVDRPDAADLTRIENLAAAPGFDRRLSLTSLADKNWVKESLDAMPPVTAGRFVVHGTHDRHRVPAHAVGIEIEANLAFGTGHHGTTRGCLLMLDDVLKRERPDRIADIGTGTGVLAIAAARALRQVVIASDIDPVAVNIARDNAVANRASAFVHPITATGFAHPAIANNAPYDLIMANILAGPLIDMAPTLARALRPGGHAILSGLLTWQGRRVLATMRGQGLVPVKRIALDGWLTLLVKRR